MMKFKRIAALNLIRNAVASVFILAAPSAAHAGFVFYELSGNFVVPVGVSEINVLLTSGGGAGAGSHYGGGGSGFLNSGTFAISAGASFTLTVGAGGARWKLLLRQ